MTKVSKISDDMILEQIEKGLSNRKIALAFGMTPSGQFNNRCAKIREGQINKKNHFDFILYDSVVWNGKLHKVTRVTESGFELHGLGSMKKTFIPYEEYEKSKDQFSKGESAPVKVYYENAEKLKEKVVPEPPIITSLLSLLEGRRPATINPEFEEAVQEMEAENKVKKEQAIAPMETVVADPEPDYIDPEWGVMKKSELCTSCGKELTPKEVYYYETQCEKCETEWMNAPKGEGSRRNYLNEIDQLLDILVPDCSEPEMEEQVKKLICYKLVIGSQKEIKQEEVGSYGY